mgnify:CR=1 FL=1
MTMQPATHQSSASESATRPVPINADAAVAAQAAHLTLGREYSNTADRATNSPKGSSGSDQSTIP